MSSGDRNDAESRRETVFVQHRKVRTQLTVASGESVRARIAREFDLDVDRMKIIYKGKVLKTAESLREHVSKGHVLYVIGSNRATHYDTTRSRGPLVRRCSERVRRYVRLRKPFVALFSKHMSTARVYTYIRM